MTQMLLINHCVTSRYMDERVFVCKEGLQLRTGVAHKAPVETCDGAATVVHFGGPENDKTRVNDVGCTQ